MHGVEATLMCSHATEWIWGLQGPSVAGDSSPAARELELWLSMPEFVEKERIYLFQSYADLE